MFRSFKVSVAIGAAVLIAASGCSLPNLLCSHSAPSEEVVVADYSGGCAGGCSVASTNCGCGCDAGFVDAGFVDAGFVDAGFVDTGMGESIVVDSEVVDDDKYIIGTPKEEATSALVQEPASNGFTPNSAANSPVAGSATKALDVVQPPEGLKSAVESALPANSLPGNLLP